MNDILSKEEKRKLSQQKYRENHREEMNKKARERARNELKIQKNVIDYKEKEGLKNQNITVKPRMIIIRETKNIGNGLRENTKRN